MGLHREGWTTGVFFQTHCSRGAMKGMQEGQPEAKRTSQSRTSARAPPAC